MNDPIEERLARLRPAPPSEALMERLNEACVASKIVRPRWFWISAISAAAAAIAMAMVFWPEKTKSPGLAQASAPVEKHRIFTPIESSNYLVRAEELGIVEPEPGRPARMVNCVWLDDDTYLGEDGVSKVRITHGREQIVLIALKTY